MDSLFFGAAFGIAVLVLTAKLVKFRKLNPETPPPSESVSLIMDEDDIPTEEIVFPLMDDLLSEGMLLEDNL